MKRFSVVLCAILLAFGIIGTVEALVIDFDDITLDPNGVIPSNYKGFSWGDQWYVESDTEYATFGNSYGSPSGEYAAYNKGGKLSVSLSSGDDFDFNGAYFTSWARNNTVDTISSTSITIEGYNDGLFLGSVTASLSFDQYDWVNVNLWGSDELVFISSGDQKWWLMDDFTYNQVPVPEPATMLLIVTGLIGLAGFGSREFKKSIN